MKKTVSVIMPVYNGEKFIAETIKSILSQTYENFEFIIIDDASSDNSLNIIRSFTDSRIKLFRNDSNIGQVKTLNKGIGSSEGKFIARIDQDDIASRNRLKRQVEFLSKYERISIVGTSAFIINEYGKKTGIFHAPTNEQHFKFELLFNNPVLHSSVILRKKALLDVGCFNEDYIFCHDYELWSRMTTSGYKLANIDEPLLYLRRHNSSSTVSLFSDIFYVEVPQVIKKNIQFFTRIDITIQDAERICKVLYSPVSLNNEEFKNTILIFEKIFNKFQNNNSRFLSGLNKTIGKFRYILALKYIERKNLVYARKYFLDSFKTYPYNLNPLVCYLITIFGAKFSSLKNFLKKFQLGLTLLFS